MRRFFFALVLFVFAVSAASAQTRRHTRPRPKAAPAKAPVKAPVKPAPPHDLEEGTVSGRTYTNKKFGFEITFPDTWLIPGDDFEAEMKKQGFDLSLKAPDSLTPQAQAKVNQAVKNVSILLTAYRSMPGTTNNAIVRVSVEDLAAHPQIKDAVDYCDAIRAAYKTMKLPADFTYSETDAEQLGAMQFAYLDTASKAGKKRMFATVRKGHAIMFTLSYTSDEDLIAMQSILEEGNFDLK